MCHMMKLPGPPEKIQPIMNQKPTTQKIRKYRIHKGLKLIVIIFSLVVFSVFFSLLSGDHEHPDVATNE